MQTLQPMQTPSIQTTPRQTPPPPLDITGYSQQVGDTHPTGMYSCYKAMIGESLEFAIVLGN